MPFSLLSLPQIGRAPTLRSRIFLAASTSVSVLADAHGTFCSHQVARSGHVVRLPSRCITLNRYPYGIG
jgi:hypothetical protein